MYVCTDIHTYIKYIYTYVYVHTLCKVYIHIEVCSAVRIAFVQHLQCSMHVHTCVTWESGLQLGYVVRWQTALKGLEHQERAPLFLPLHSALRLPCLSAGQVCLHCFILCHNRPQLAGFIRKVSYLCIHVQYEQVTKKQYRSVVLYV